MVKEITSEGIQKKFDNIVRLYMNYIENDKNFFKDNMIIKVLLLKKASNIDSANILCSKGRIYESKIIIRSAFESLVLFEYLINFPEEIIKYNKEEGISLFKNCYALYKRGYMPLVELSEAFSQLDKGVQKELLKNKKNNQALIFRLDLVEKNLQEYRSDFQNIRYMIGKLKNTKSNIVKMMENYLFDIYGINSQITHGECGAITEYFGKKWSDEDFHEKFIDCYRQLFFIISYSGEILRKLNIITNTLDLQEEIKIFLEYINYNSLLKEMNTRNKPTSDILEIITYKK